MGIFDGVEYVGNAELADREDQPVGRLLAGELIDVGIHLLGGAAEVDGLADEGTGHPHIGIVAADLVGFAARKSREAEGVAEPEALVDLRIDPQFRALPQLQSGIERGVPGLAACIGVEAVGAAVRRAKRRRVLADISGLAVNAPVVALERRQAPIAGTRAVAAELVIQPEANLLHGKVRVEALSGQRKRHAGGAEAGIEVFEPCGPMRHQRRLDPRPHGPAAPSRQLDFDGAAARAGGVVAELGARQAIRGPGIAGGPVIEPAVEGIADAGAHRAGHFHQVAVGRRADRRRRQGAGAGHVAGKRYVGLDTDHADPI